MKSKHAIILLALGFCLDFFGAVRKIMHAPGADTIFIIATVMKIFGVLILVYKITTYPKTKDFMNW